MKTKVFASYLPQYHEIEENNLFWGDGYTDWVGVRNAEPQFDGHIQPKVPECYYDLSDYKVLSKQAELAKKYKIDGFNIYHYWFKNGHKVLEKPAENLLNHKEIDINFFFSWDNSSWVKSWSNISGNAWAPKFESAYVDNDSGYLLECDYGDENDWKEHFEYLFPFFCDSRYYKIDGRPVFVFFTDRDSDRLKRMADYWEQLIMQKGYDGMFFIVQKAPFLNKKIFENQFIYYPLAVWNRKRAIKNLLKKYIGLKEKKYLHIYDYDKCWKKIIKEAKRYKQKKIFYSALVKYDDTPRRGANANIFIGNTPEKFEKYFGELYNICCRHRKEFMLITAWNEWGEGAYLESDSVDGFKYLEAIKNVVEKK